ncbi:MAG: hypothetical protein E7664_04750 [Ruminococcaceae bacterium]|nr:hypothetical protein [Oscillospiraceae bacterium]
MDAKQKKQVSNCETCVYFDYDEDAEADVCTANLDEDDMVRFLGGSTFYCPFYRFYDEYKSVRRQN